MSSRLRFATANSVYEASADLRMMAEPPADGAAPLDHARTLLGSKRPNDAILFLAHVLPRREAVWWAIQCVRGLLGGKAEDEALQSAESWVRAPEDETRLAALAIARAADPRAATTLLAFAAGCSGGNIGITDLPPMPAPPSACGNAANAAIMMAVTAGEPRSVMEKIRACAEAGIRFADGGEASVNVPAAPGPG
jgi:hypothetical protein